MRTAINPNGPSISSCECPTGACVVSQAVVERIRTIRTTRTTIRITVVLRIRRSGVAGSRVALSCYTFIAADGAGAASPLFVVELSCQVGRTPTTHHSAHQRPSEVADFVARDPCHFNIAIIVNIDCAT